MKKVHRILVCCLAVLTALTMTAFAADGEPEAPAVGSITVKVKNTADQKPIPGAKLKNTFVASFAEQDGNWKLEYTDSFADCKESLDDLKLAGLADRLAAYGNEKECPGTFETADQEGTAVFSDLEPGLYLIEQVASGEKEATIKPFLVVVAEGEHVIATPKGGTDVTPPPSPTPTPTSPGTNTSKLPQTGLLWWPVPILAIVGMLLIVIGWKKRNAQKTK